MKFRTFGLIFFAIGIPFLIGLPIATANSMRRVSHSICIPGTIIDLNNGRPTVAYEFPANVRRLVEGDVGGSHYDVGEKLDVLIDPSNPDSASLGDFASLWFVPIMLFLFGLTFGGMGVGILTYLKSQKQKKEYLMRNGEILTAKIKGVEENYSVSMNGSHPYRIKAQAVIDSKVYVFKVKTSGLTQLNTSIAKRSTSTPLSVILASTRWTFLSCQSWSSNGRLEATLLSGQASSFVG